MTNWIEYYLKYTEETESPKIFHKWTAYACLSAALQRKTWFKLGRFKIYPNLYIILVAEPGVARKTQAKNFGEDILSSVPSIVLSADSTSPQAMLEDLENCKQSSQCEDGTVSSHNSLTVFAGELESFMGQKSENQKMLVWLTDLYDCKSRPFTYRVKNSKSAEISAPYLSILGCTTPESLSSCFPVSAIGGGLGSRVLFIWGDSKQKSVAVPPDVDEDLTETIIQNLIKISDMKGERNFAPNAEKLYTEWYDSLTLEKRICKDMSFAAWYSRKHTHVLKLAQCIAAAKGEFDISWDSIYTAISEIESIEPYMANALIGVGRNEFVNEMEIALKLIKQATMSEEGGITEAKLLQLMWRDVDAVKFDSIINTLTRRDMIEFNGKSYKAV